MENIQSLLDKRPRTDECQEVGIKLRNLLETPAKAQGAPDTLLELYLWTVAKFSDNNIDACQKVSEIIKNSNNNEHILICAKSQFCTLKLHNSGHFGKVHIF